MMIVNDKLYISIPSVKKDLKLITEDINKYLK